LDAAVLQALSATTGLSTGAHVHRLAGTGSPDGVRKTLARLVRQGIVLVEEHGHANLYRLNRDHVAAAPILALTRLRGQILDNIIGAIGDWSVPPVHASLFGSFARGDADEASDIDILLVSEPRANHPEASGAQAETWQAQIDQLASDVHRWTGNHSQVVDITRNRLSSMVDSNDPLIGSWRVDHVHLTGQRLLDLLRNN
jgi:predicted nucleotidyltransferase